MPDEETEQESWPEGTVYRVNSGNYSVRTDSGEILVCRLRGVLKKDLVYSTSTSRPRRVDSANKRRSSDPIAVGDRVRVDFHRDLIAEILPRHSTLSRMLPLSHEQHVLVANLDQLFVVVSAADPQPDLWILDRFLVMAEASDVHASIIVNKIDKLGDDLSALRAQLQPYYDCGYGVYYVSAKRGAGLDELRAGMRGHITTFAGPSGVGKSSLLNALQPGLRLVVGETGSITHKGRHTTTSAELIPFADGGWIADTPGLRQVNFWEVDPSDIPFCFLEIAPLLGQCRFANCGHQSEVGCGIRAAVDDGRIDRRRYESFLQMMQEK